MRFRPTARVLLLDPKDRILLMKGRLAHTPATPGEWFTVGGGIEPGETVAEAAAREIIEETGFIDAVVGPVVWRRDGSLGLPGEMFQEYYVVARCAGGKPSRQGWEAHEHALIDDIRWWSLPELMTTGDRVHPIGLTGCLPDILAARYPPEPIFIDWR